MSTTTALRMTAEQYHEWSTERDGTELVGGEVIVSQPKPIHGLIQLDLAAALRTWVGEGQGRGLALLPTSVTLDNENVYGPDVLWFSEDHIPPDLREYPERVPDLCVEIRSPGTWRYDVGMKKAVYEAGGLPELWLVDDVAEVVLAFRRSTPGAPRFDVALELGRAQVLTSPQLPGFALPLDRLFRR